jgi:predicted ATPase
MTALRFRPPRGDWVRAPNMGFGVSYALPIILAGLYARDGALLVIENPEAHLHPAGQSRVGYFLGVVASAGVQIVIETHSDHVINGIRRAIADTALAPDQAVVHFFDSLTDQAELEHSTLRFTATGGLSDWPKRFFDQYEIDVVALSRVRRQKRGK